jgi:hypothetical protein
VFFLDKILSSPYFILIRASVKCRLRKRNVEYKRECPDPSLFNERSGPGKLFLAKERKGK